MHFRLHLHIAIWYDNTYSEIWQNKRIFSFGGGDTVGCWQKKEEICNALRKR